MAKEFYRLKRASQRRIPQGPLGGSQVIDFADALRRHDQRGCVQPWYVLEQENLGLDLLRTSIANRMSYQDRRDYDDLTARFQGSRSVEVYNLIIPQKKEILKPYCPPAELTYPYLRSRVEQELLEGIPGMA